MTTPSRNLLLSALLGLSSLSHAATVAEWRLNDFPADSQLPKGTEFLDSATPSRPALLATGDIRLESTTDVPGSKIHGEAQLESSLRILGSKHETALIADVGSNLNHQDFTVEAFIKAEKALEWATIFALRRMEGPDWVSWSLQVNPDGYLVSRFDTNPSASDLNGFNGRLATTFLLCDGKWHHVALTVEGSTGLATLYVDADAMDKNFKIKPLPIKFDDSAQLHVGKGFTGSISNLRISDSILPPEQFLKAEQ